MAKKKKEEDPFKTLEKIAKKISKLSREDRKKVLDKVLKPRKTIPRQPISIDAEKLAMTMLEAYRKHEKRGIDCGNLVLEWSKEYFWGALVKEHIPMFERVWELLDREKHTVRNKFVYGDIDVGLWIEYPKKREKRKVIVSTRYCSCADDNTHIFVYDHDDREKKPYYDFSKFKVVTVWPRQKRSKYWKTVDEWHRHIDLPSINTYRKSDWDYGYNDCRDKGHCFLYEAHNERVEKAHWSENKIKHALWTLVGHFQMLEEEYGRKKAIE